MILFTDLDGTLLTDTKELTPGNRKAIEEALFAGHQIVISTGRPLCGAKNQAEKLGLNGKGCYIICFNGGEIYDCWQKKSIYRQTLPLWQVRFVFDEAKKRGLAVQTYDSSSIYCEEDRIEFKNYSQIFQVPLKVVPDVLSHLTEEPCKVLVINESSRKMLEQFRNELLPWARGRMDLFFSCDKFLELVPLGVSKGHGMELLCRHLGVSIKDTVAVGDAENDGPMIQAAGTGAVMINGDVATKALGDYITTRDNNHDGVAEVIEKFLLKK